MKRISMVFCIAVVALATASTAGASLLFLPNTYGLSARGIGLGNALTAVNADYSTTYFNPAALATLDNHSVNLSYLYALPDFSGGRKDGETIDFDEANQIGIIGLLFDLSKLFKNDHGLGLGMDVALDDNLSSFLAFEEVGDERGQFVRYGMTSVTVAFGLGVEIIDQLHIGGGAFILVKGENKLIAETDLAGNTKNEEIQVDATPAIAPIVSVFAPVHDMVTIGASYRGEAVAQFDAIDAQTQALVSGSPLTTLNLLIFFKDTYVPQQASLGISIRPIPELLLALDATWANWGEYEDEITDKDSPREFSEIHTRDVWIPRLGIEWTAYENLFVRFGYFYEDSPFSNAGSGGSIILDNAKHAGSIGLAYDITQIDMLNFPVSIGATYFLHYLVPRTMETADGIEFESEGTLNGVIATLQLRF